MPVTPEELHERFTYHPPKPGQPELYQALRGKGKELAELIVASTPESREQSLALTNLEQACFWANAAIARRG
jgi:hypothetical protein